MTPRPGPEPASINVSALLDSRPINGFQWLTYGLCVACLMMDGFDLQALSFAAPSLIREWKIPSAAMGPVFSAALLGILFGSFLWSMLADRVGRRPVLFAATLWFAVLTYLTGQAGSLAELTTLRFIAGVGLGGIMPNAMALAGEYAPGRKRILIMMIVSTGFTVGAAIAGVTAEWLIPLAGWRSLFTFGAAASLVTAAVMVAFLPESLPFLALSGRPPEAARRWIRRIAPELARGEQLSLTAQRAEKGLPLGHLFREGRALTTILLWIVNFMNLLVLYFLTSWLPTAVRDFGFSNLIAVRAGTFVQIGGIIGGLLLGLVAQRLGLGRVLIACFLAGCLSLAAISRTGLPAPGLFAIGFVAGFAIFGGQVGVNALAATCYPTSLRATGIGASLGVGRIGGILGPAIAGALLARHWQPHTLFLGAAIPAALSCLAVFLLRFVPSRSE